MPSNLRVIRILKFHGEDKQQKILLINVKDAAVLVGKEPHLNFPYKFQSYV